MCGIQLLGCHSPTRAMSPLCLKMMAVIDFSNVVKYLNLIYVRMQYVNQSTQCK